MLASLCRLHVPNSVDAHLVEISVVGLGKHKAIQGASERDLLVQRIHSWNVRRLVTSIGTGLESFDLDTVSESGSDVHRDTHLVIPLFLSLVVVFGILLLFFVIIFFLAFLLPLLLFIFLLYSLDFLFQSFFLRLCGLGLGINDRGSKPSISQMGGADVEEVLEDEVGVRAERSMQELRI